MSKFLVLFVLGVMILLSLDGVAYAQVTSGNGYLGYNMNAYGRIRVSIDPYTTSPYEVGRFNPIAALSAKAVCDYMDDQQTVTAPYAVTIPKVNDAIEGIFDGSYGGMFNYLRVRETIMSWTNAPYLVARFRYYNDSAAAVKLYLGAIMIGRPSGVYGLETVKYDAPSKTAYFFRTGETPYWGIRLLNKTTYSVKIRDWDNYSSDPSNDYATDSVRYLMTATTGFDTSLTGGLDGTIYNVNAGQVTLASKDSTDLYYAIGYGTSAATVIRACDSARAKVSGFFTAVPRDPVVVPVTNKLDQNYPNPFNPETQITFDITHAAFTTLKVYNITGQEVSTLLEQQVDPGRYAVKFSARNLPSGIYYYRIQAGNWTSVKKMVLMK